MSLNLAEGSIAGSLITAFVPGIGIETKDVSLQVNDKNICQTATVEKYGVLKCFTKNQQVGTADAPADIVVKIGAGNVGRKYSCASVDKTKCQYKQLD